MDATKVGAPKAGSAHNTPGFTINRSRDARRDGSRHLYETNVKGRARSGDFVDVVRQAAFRAHNVDSGTIVQAADSRGPWRSAIGQRRAGSNVKILYSPRHAGHHVCDSPSHGIRPIAVVHTPEYLRFLENAWTEWRKLEGAADEVLPYVFPLRGMTGGYPSSIVGQAGHHLHDLWVPIGEHTWEAAVASANLAVDAAHRVPPGGRRCRGGV